MSLAATCVARIGFVGSMSTAAIGVETRSNGCSLIERENTVPCHDP